MGSVWASFRSGRGGVVALVSALALSSACGRTGLLAGGDAEIDPVGGDGGRSGAAGGGRGGRGFGGAAGVAGSGPVEPMGGAGFAGAGGQPQQSQYCAAGERAVLYLLTEDMVILRVDADTLETITRVGVDAAGLYSLTATDNGVVYATSVLELYRIDPLSGEAVNVNLRNGVFESNSGRLTVGFSPADPVVFGDTLLLAQDDLAGGINLYATPVSSFLPLWRHRFQGMSQRPEFAVAPDGRTFALLSEGFVEYDPGILSELGTLAVPGLPEGWTGDVAYLSGYLFASYAMSQTASRLYRVEVMSDLEDSPIEELGPIADAIIGIGAACEAPP